MSEDTPKPRFSFADIEPDPKMVALRAAFAITPRVSPSVMGAIRDGYDRKTREWARNMRFELPPAPWKTDEGEQYAAGFWLPYCASEADARQHIKDFFRTCITPGTSPRAQWDVGVYFHDPDADGPVFERCGSDGALLMTRGPDYDDRRYVPHDVCRWRSTKHRDELTRRARELAAAAQRAMGGP